MAYEITINGSKMTLEKNERILDIIQSRDPEKRAVAARVNRRLRDLNFEIQGPCDIEVIQNNDIEAMKVYEASLRYVVAMAFANCYPQLHIRFAGDFHPPPHQRVYGQYGDATNHHQGNRSHHRRRLSIKTDRRPQ